MPWNVSLALRIDLRTAGLNNAERNGSSVVESLHRHLFEEPFMHALPIYDAGRGPAP